MSQDRYHPWQIEELGDPVSLINEPPPPDNIALLIPRSARPIHAVLVENLTNVRALITRLEIGVQVPARGRAPIRELYVSARALRDALSAALELDELA